MSSRDQKTLESVSFAFNPIPDDYVRSSRGFMLRSWSMRLMMVRIGLVIVLAGCIIMVGLYSTLARRDANDMLYTGALALICILVSVGPLAYMLVIIPYLQARRFQKDERLQAEVRWNIDDEWLKISTKYAESKMDWGTFQKVIELKDYYLLVYTANKRLYQLIPKRAFESPELESAFRAIVERHLGPIKN